MIIVAAGPRVSFPGSQQHDTRFLGECVMPGRGPSPWQVIQRFASELGRAVPFPTEASNEAEEARRRYGGMAVGLTHGRGVNGVMSIESQEPGTLEGVSSRTQRAEVDYAIH